MDAVACQLADLHARSPHTAEIDAAGDPDVVAGLWAESIDHLRRLEVGRDAPELVDRVEGLSRRWLDGRRGLLTSRVAAGRVVDGHGDLLAADIYCLDDGPRVVDCLEFDDRLRVGDAVLDAGVLVMDLERRGHVALPARFLDAYRAASGDDAPDSLVDFSCAYRALVRAEVSAIRAGQADGDAGVAAAHEALDLLAWCGDRLARAIPRLVLVGGVSGSGKSTLARSLSEASGAAWLRSDVIRKELAGLDPDVSASAAPGAGLYEPGMTERTYAEVLRRAGVLLAEGRSVVADATWLDPRRRTEAETCASEAHAELVEIECTAPAEVLFERLAARRLAGADPSDATEEVLEEQLASRAAWPEAVVVDTTANTPVAQFVAWEPHKLRHV